jgi:hypothetical protein
MGRKSASVVIKPSMFYVTPMNLIKKWYSDLPEESIAKGIHKTQSDYRDAMIHLSMKAVEKKVPFNEKAKGFFSSFMKNIQNKVPQEKTTLHKEIPLSRDALGEYIASATYHIDEKKNSNDLTLSVYHTFNNPLSGKRLAYKNSLRIIRKLKRLGYI